MNKIKKYKYSPIYIGVVLCSISLMGNARVTGELGDGEYEVEGYVRSESRWKIEDDKYMTQWINRAQVEASLNYEDKGIFDELSFVSVLRPEYDIAHTKSGLNEGHVGRDSDEPSYLGNPFNYANDPIGYAGFDILFGAADAGLLSTGGLYKNVTQGVWAPGVMNEFEVIAHETPFPLLSPMSDRSLNCKNCSDVDVDHRRIAMANTDASGELYPIRELYVDMVKDDWWFRIGKQQVVWGKTDFFRLQDIINPIDFGQHFFYDPFEDTRIPQWIATLQYKGGSFGPLNDTALQVVWNFDKFKSTGLGNPSHAWAHPFGKEKALFAAFNTYFSPEPCVSEATVLANGASPDAVCQEGDGRLPSGFGIPVGLGEEHLPDHSLDNTEIGFRYEFRIKDFRMAWSYYYGWNDTPVFRFDTVNVDAARVSGVTPNDNLVIGMTNGALLGLPTGSDILNPVAVLEPSKAIAQAAAAGDPDAIAALENDNARLFYQTGKTFGGLTSIVYDQSHTTGLSVDYFDDWSGIVFRFESSYTFDELVNNTRKANWVDHSDVVRYSIGLDRPTFLRWLNKDRTFFLSFQLFDTWYLDHEGGDTDGYYTEEHNRVYTFYWETHYKRDTIKPSGFVVWEENSDTWVLGANVTWFINNNWTVKAGVHKIGRTEDDPGRFDVGPFTSFTLDGNYAQQAVFGFAKEGIGALSGNDEAFLQVQYQF